MKDLGKQSINMGVSNIEKRWIKPMGCSGEEKSSKCKAMNCWCSNRFWQITRGGSKTKKIYGTNAKWIEGKVKQSLNNRI